MSGLFFTSLCWSLVINFFLLFGFCSLSTFLWFPFFGREWRYWTLPLSRGFSGRWQRYTFCCWAWCNMLKTKPGLGHLNKSWHPIIGHNRWSRLGSLRTCSSQLCSPLSSFLQSHRSSGRCSATVNTFCSASFSPARAANIMCFTRSRLPLRRPCRVNPSPITGSFMPLEVSLGSQCDADGSRDKSKIVASHFWKKQQQFKTENWTWTNLSGLRGCLQTHGMKDSCTGARLPANLEKISHSPWPWSDT